MNTPDRKAAFMGVIETAVSKQNGLHVHVMNVLATDASGVRRRRLLVDKVEVAYSLFVPTTAGGPQDQAVFNSLKTDLIAGAGAGGSIATEAAASLGGLEHDHTAFVAPDTFVSVDSASTCVGDHVIVSPSSGACTCGKLRKT